MIEITSTWKSFLTFFIQVDPSSVTLQRFTIYKIQGGPPIRGNNHRLILDPTTPSSAFGVIVGMQAMNRSYKEGVGSRAMRRLVLMCALGSLQFTPTSRILLASSFCLNNHGVPPSNNVLPQHRWMDAFAASINPSSQSPLRYLSLISSSLRSSSDDNDEISKLISKRSQIKRKKREDVENQILSSEPMVDINLDSLPEFKTERPVRRISSDNDEEGDEAAAMADKATEPSSPIVDFMADHEDENDFHIPNRMGVSTIAWGDISRNFVPSGKLTKRSIQLGKFVPGDLQLTHTKLLEGGIVLFATSPSHGSAMRNDQLSAEDILKRCLDEQMESLPETMIAEELGKSAWTQLTKPSTGMSQALEDSLSRLGMATVELFQAPKSLLYPTALLASGLASALESGQCNYVGVQGIVSAGKLRKLKAQLEARDVTLTTNSFEFSLTSRKHEKMIDICKALGVIPLVTNPLDGGLASGVYTATNPSGGKQGGGAVKFSFKELEKLQPLHSVLETVSERVRTRVIREMRDTQARYKSRYGPPPKINTDITTTQVALNYVVAKGGVPLPEVNTPTEAAEVLGCLGWKLNDDEVSMLDAAAALCSL